MSDDGVNHFVAVAVAVAAGVSVVDFVLQPPEVQIPWLPMFRPLKVRGT